MNDLPADPDARIHAPEPDNLSREADAETVGLDALLRECAPGGCAFRQTTDGYGVATAWCELAEAADLFGAAKLLKTLGARLSTITAYQPHQPEVDTDDSEEDKPELLAPLNGLPIDGKTYQILYHFDLDGSTVSLIVFLPETGGAAPSLTPLFRTADWNERELMEIYNITIADHPNPRRLFLDESIDPAVLERLIPFSTLVNAASTKSLWEKIVEKHEGMA